MKDAVWRTILVLVIVWAVFATVMVYIGASRALGHEWYPSECCSGTDCEVLDPHQVTETQDSYVIQNGDETVMVPKHLARKSQDLQYHWCRTPEYQPTGPYNGEVKRSPRRFITPRREHGTNIDDRPCLFVPPPSF